MVCIVQFFGWRATAMASIRVGCLSLEEAGQVVQVRIAKWDDKTMRPSERKPLGLMSFPRVPWLQ